ncbi:Mediator of RNA polymerase II transcription subunit 25 [Halocaridina rubra]|uniref:Mediator of RNA polymerase II transcription subunit 25 n=1 Tax=Halocaridina rubra TaxID=373956 RepID=A0AAN9AGX9_HALRR
MNYDRSDVVFVIEKSISLKKYLPELLEAYITPTISCFGGGLSEETDVFFSQSSLVQYGAVFYGTELSLLGSWGQVESYGPTCSEREIFSAINNACYTCKNLTRQAFILEGLQAALNLFEKMKQHSQVAENVQRSCILITQSTPMSNPWSPTSPEKVLLEIKRVGIQLSIISAHKLVELYRLFDAAGGDYQANPAKNYASKPQHLVLLNGVTLQERALSPSLISTYTPVTAVPTPPTTHGTGSVGVTVCTATGPGPSPSSNISGAATPSSGAAGSPAPQPMVRPNVPVGQPTLPPINPNAPPGGRMRAPMGIGTNRPRWSAGPGPRGMIVNQAQQTLQGDSMTGKVQQPGVPNVDMQTGLPSIQQPQIQCPNVPGAPGVGQGMNMQSQRTVVWQGTLEWQEKKADSNSRIVHQVTCKMTSLIANGEPEVKAEGWSQRLTMQMIPKTILGSIGNTFFKNVNTVMFLPDQSHALDTLTAFLFKGMAGCVHVSPAGPAQQSDVKIIILLFSSEKKAYVGFIPLDQTSFVNKIKNVIHSAKKGQLPGALMQPGGVPTSNPSPAPPMMVPGNPGIQSMPTNAGMMHPGMTPLIQQNPNLTQVLSQPANQGLAGGQMQQITVPQGTNMGQPGGSGVTVSGPIGGCPSMLASQLATRPTLGMQQQPTEQEKIQIMMRQSQQNQIRQQLQQQLQQRPVSCAPIGQSRMMQPTMQNPGLRQLLQQQQQVRLQQQQQVHQQQQQQQQQQIIMMQQQGIRPQLTQQGQQVLGQTINQQGMGQQTMGQQTMGQQTMNQQGVTNHVFGHRIFNV